jgi:Domain of unknown function (DUF4157)
MTLQCSSRQLFAGRRRLRCAARPEFGYNPRVRNHATRGPQPGGSTFDPKPSLQRPRAQIKERAPLGPQGRLTVGPAGDRFEQEADRVADEVTRAAPPAPPAPPGDAAGWSIAAAQSNYVQRACSGCAQEEEKVRGAPRGAALAPAAGLARNLDGTRGGGAPLPAATRTFFEPRFGADFTGVRVHDDHRAHVLAERLDAQAFTVGSDIYFGAGRFAPETSPGRRLLAHELTHTVQQRGGAAAPLIQRAGAGGCARTAENVDEERDELALAGRLAHAQIQGVFSGQLDSEVRVPRGTKVTRGTPCPPTGTADGRADLFRFSGGLADAQVGEIKSINGARFAAPDAQHYLDRMSESARRIGGTSCGGPADAADATFDRNWMRGQLARGQVPPFNPLDGVVPPTPTDMGPFAGDPLEKELFCQRRAGGAVLYWCRKRNLDEQQKQRERQVLQIPVGEDVRRTVPQTGTRPPNVVDIVPEFRDPMRTVPRPMLPTGRDFVIVTSEPMFSTVVESQRMLDTIRRMRIDLRNNPVFQFRQLTWSTAAIIMATGVAGAIIAAIGVAAIPTAAAGTAVVAAGGTAAGGGAVVIPLFGGAAATATATEVIKAAAAVIIVSSVALNGGDAHAETDVNRALAPGGPVIQLLDVTDDTRAVGGGPARPGAARLGAAMTVNNQPYRVIAVLTTN